MLRGSLCHGRMAGSAVERVVPWTHSIILNRAGLSRADLRSSLQKEALYG